MRLVLAMKYAWIQKNAVCWLVRTQCRVLEVSVPGYYQHYARRSKNTARRHLSQVAFLVEIRAMDRAMQGAYGVPASRGT